MIIQKKSHKKIKNFDFSYKKSLKSAVNYLLTMFLVYIFVIFTFRLRLSVKTTFLEYLQMK